VLFVVALVLVAEAGLEVARRRGLGEPSPPPPPPPSLSVA
jgi:hypothetical protein